MTATPEDIAAARKALAAYGGDGIRRHIVICAEKPIIRRIAGSLSRPKLSNSMSIPLALTWGIKHSLR